MSSTGRAPPASPDDTIGISDAVVNYWFYNRQDATYVGHEEVFADNGWSGYMLCYVSCPAPCLFPLDTDFVQIPEARGFSQIARQICVSKVGGVLILKSNPRKSKNGGYTGT